MMPVRKHLIEVHVSDNGILICWHFSVSVRFSGAQCHSFAVSECEGNVGFKVARGVSETPRARVYFVTGRTD